MKTVPSGRFETCMYGAPAVGGTEGATILKTPAIVGRPVGKAPPVVSEFPPVIVGTAPVAAAEEPKPVMMTEVDWIDWLPVSEDPVAESVFDPVFDRVAEPVFDAVIAESVLEAVFGLAEADAAAAALSDSTKDERLGTAPA
jgi:hypothetical protein